MSEQRPTSQQVKDAAVAEVARLRARMARHEAETAASGVLLAAAKREAALQQARHDRKQSAVDADRKALDAAVLAAKTVGAHDRELAVARAVGPSRVRHILVEQRATRAESAESAA